MFSVLAFSYESLPDEATNLVSCIALYFQRIMIYSSNLIQLWIEEGFVDEYDNIQEAINQGREIIERLKSACLLQEGRSPMIIGTECLKMHDVIRDMALWLACEKGKKKNKFVVKDGVGLIRAQEVQKWKDAQKISLWNNTTVEELKKPPHFPSTETTLMQRMESFPQGFFTNMLIIRVLDISENEKLVELPVEIGDLITLQYLNLSWTGIKYLPTELKNLKFLRCLRLDGMFSLEPLPSQMVSSLSSLQLFSMQYLSFTSKVDGITLLKELEQLEHINDISITLRGRVLPAQILFNSHKLQ